MPLLGLVVLNVLALAWYALVYSGVARSVDRQLEQRTRELEAVQAAVAAQELTLERLRFNESQLEAFYGTRLAPPSERLTDVIREVRTLARTAGLQPSAIDYPRDDLSEYGLVKRSFSFGVEGSYEQLRRFVNLLELTDSFLTLEEISLSGRRANEMLRINLRLSTLFAVDEETGSSAPARAAPTSAEPAGRDAEAEATP
jgi:Tfp pilus assembly protein PilO